MMLRLSVKLFQKLFDGTDSLLGRTFPRRKSALLYVLGITICWCIFWVYLLYTGVYPSTLVIWVVALINRYIAGSGHPLRIICWESATEHVTALCIPYDKAKGSKSIWLAWQDHQFKRKYANRFLFLKELDNWWRIQVLLSGMRGNFSLKGLFPTDLTLKIF